MKYVVSFTKGGQLPWSYLALETIAMSGRVIHQRFTFNSFEAALPVRDQIKKANPSWDVIIIPEDWAKEILEELQSDFGQAHGDGPTNVKSLNDEYRERGLTPRSSKVCDGPVD